MAKIALLIGVSEYEPGLNPLPAAVKDLDAMKEVLQHPDMGGFAESDILLLKNPKRQEMEESIETLFANRHRDDLVLLFFSGHGIKDDAGRLYLGTRKTRKTPQGDLVRSSAVAANFVHENMSRSRSRRQVVILDSCFSGAFAEGMSAKDDGTVDIRTQLGGEGRAVLTSSSSTQYSFEQEGEELSLYTRFLIEGIKTGAADLDEDDVVSIDELHEYASRKVREVKPELKPEIYAMREGFKIRLSKVPQGDPCQRYQKEVARCGKRGELTIVSRSILDTWRIRLGLSIDVAKALENEVLEPYRRDFQQKLQQYEQTVVDVLQRDGSIDEHTRHELRQLQQVLELRNEDTVPIEARITAHAKTHKQNLETYKQSFSEALRQEYPLGEASRSRLQQMQQQLALSETDVTPIEAQVTTEVEIYRRNLQDYEQVFLTATQQEYPLSQSKRAELRRHQSSLGLSDVEIAPIEAKVTTQIETYQQKLEQYKETFARSTQSKYLHGEANRSQLIQTWRTLGLDEADVKAIEEPILAQVKTHQAHLRQYEQAFVDATEQEYPVSQAKRSDLRQLQRSLNLSDEDVESIESRVKASVEEHLQKLQQYEQVFLDSIKFEFPVSEDTREELKRLQQILELDNEEVAQIEEKITAQAEQLQNEEQSDTPLSILQSIEVDTPQDAKIPNALEPAGLDQTGLFLPDTQDPKIPKTLQQYELEVVKYINAGISPKDYVVSRKLNVLRNALKLSLRETEAIESRLVGNPEPQSVVPPQSITDSSQEYEIEVIKYVNVGISLKDYVIRQKLDTLRNKLGLSLQAAEAIEMRLMGRTQSPMPPHSSSPEPEPTRSSQSSTAREFRWIEEPIQPESDSFIDKHSATIRLLGSLFPIFIIGSIVMLLSGKQETTPTRVI
jgi:Caspase domain